MTRDIPGFSVVRRLRQSPVFAFLVAALLCGVLAGSITGMHIPQAEDNYVNDLARLVAGNAVGKLPTVRTVVLCFAGVYAWMLLAVALGFLAGRYLWVALLMALRGFLLSFAAAAALTESGLGGLYISVVSIGISAVFWMPAMLLVCSAVLDTGMLQGRQAYWAALRRNRAAFLMGALLLLCAVLWKLLAVPVLLGFTG